MMPGARDNHNIPLRWLLVERTSGAQYLTGQVFHSNCQMAGPCITLHIILPWLVNMWNFLGSPKLGILD